MERGRRTFGEESEQKMDVMVFAVAVKLFERVGGGVLCGESGKGDLLIFSRGKFAAHRRLPSPQAPAPSKVESRFPSVLIVYMGPCRDGPCWRRAGSRQLESSVLTNPLPPLRLETRQRRGRSGLWLVRLASGQLRLAATHQRLVR